jgi:L-methionine (R)-S-oxide reductase
MDYASSENFLESLNSYIGMDRKRAFQEICSQLARFNSAYNWVGIYVLENNKLVLDAFVGKKTEHEQITLGDGLCSLAIVRNEIVNEADVHSNKKYLACFPETKSELVVPIRAGKMPVGEIDIDSDTKGAFKREDEKFIQNVADFIGRHFF